MRLFPIFDCWSNRFAHGSTRSQKQAQSGLKWALLGVNSTCAFLCFWPFYTLPPKIIVEAQKRLRKGSERKKNPWTSLKLRLERNFRTLRKELCHVAVLLLLCVELALQVQWAVTQNWIGPAHFVCVKDLHPKQDQDHETLLPPILGLYFVPSQPASAHSQDFRLKHRPKATQVGGRACSVIRSEGYVRVM